MKKSTDFGQIKNRIENHAPNPKLDLVIKELKTLLEPVQRGLNDKLEDVPRLPVGLLVGNPRSGSTLLTQVLSASGFAYPSNLLNRFAYAPYIGLLIQKMIFDEEHQYQGNMVETQPNRSFASDLGKSKGALSPSEFLPFWRRFLPGYDMEWLTEKDILSIDFHNLKSEITQISRSFKTPLMMKGPFCQYNIPEFFNKMPFLFFVRLKRDPNFCMQSILSARDQFYADRSLWWSVKPREYPDLARMDVYHQIAGQVYFTEKAIDEGMSRIPEERSITINYENLCNKPADIVKSIREKFSKLGYEIGVEYNGPGTFKFKNSIRIQEKDYQSLQKAYQSFSDDKSSS